ncbi:hypothetical protein ACLKA7_009322 [Drosophila subpalustris]
MLWEYLAIFVVLLLLAYRWATANYSFFKDRGIDYHKPYPFVGSMWKMILRKKSMFDLVIELYNQSSSKAYGFFELRKPLLMIRDPELIKQITIKDFDYFLNHRNIFGVDNEDPHEMDNLFSSSLFSLRDSRWKDMRSTLSPAFTGRKMRQMFQLMNIVANEAVQCLKRDQIAKEGFELDMKDYFTRFTNDVIASTAFGLQVNSFTELENTFYMLGKRLTNLTALQNLKFILFISSKKLFRKLLRLKLFDKKSTDYFVHLVLDAMKYRQEHKIVRPDMINMLMEASGMIQTDKTKFGTIHNWSDREIVAQCFIFFFAGFETSAVLMCFTAHELMENEDVQKRLYEEVEQVNKDLDGGELTYEALMGMKYMDQVVSEVLRKWPPAVATDRECNKDITYEVDGTNIEIKKGEIVWLPISGFHRDPKYFENPEKFDPERFSDKNKDKIQPFTYFPFGVGQRNCIGSRFALLEAKAIIYYLLRDFRIAASKKTNYNFFRDRGIDHHKPYPFLGSMWKMILRQKSMFDLIIELYNKSDSKVYGIFEQRSPLLMIRDPELIKQITIKDFDHFVNHWNIFGGGDDDLHNMHNVFGSSLFAMRDKRWKDMRSTLSPVFTGSKLRNMFQLMNIVANDSVQFLKDEKFSKDGFDLDMKDCCTRFTNDVIASTAFGIHVNSFKDRENTFYMLGKKLTELTTWQNFKFFLFTRLKKRFRQLLRLTLFDKKSTDYFVRLVLEAMEYRQEHNIVKPDMINMLMEASGMIQTDTPKFGTIHNWSYCEIVAQCFIFFFAGFETSAVLMCFTAHELMENEDVQKRLYEEVEQVNKDLDGGELTYEALMGMKYMDQVVSEVLRKWPPAVAADRECNKDITYEVDGTNIEIKKGEVVWLPISGFHRDPKYFENPEKFDPERFSNENKHKIQPFSYYPFGVGQRNCIGSRFALLEAKAIIYYLLRDFRIAVSKKSMIPIVLGANGFQIKPIHGFWVKLMPRS